MTCFDTTGGKGWQWPTQEKHMAEWCWVQVHYDWHCMWRFGMQWVCELGDSSMFLWERIFEQTLHTNSFSIPWGSDVSSRRRYRGLLTSLARVGGTQRPSLFNPFGVLRNPSNLPKAAASQHGLSPKPPNHLARSGKLSPFFRGSELFKVW